MKQSEPWTQTTRTALWNPSRGCGVHYPPALQQCCRNVRPSRPHGKVVYSANFRKRCIFASGSSLRLARSRRPETFDPWEGATIRIKDAIAIGSEDRRPLSKRGETRGSSRRRMTGTYKRCKFPLRPALLIHNLHRSLMRIATRLRFFVCQTSFVRSLQVLGKYLVRRASCLWTDEGP